MGALRRYCLMGSYHFAGCCKPSSIPTYQQHSDAQRDNGKENLLPSADKDQNHTQSQDLVPQQAQ